MSINSSLLRLVPNGQGDNKKNQVILSVEERVIKYKQKKTQQQTKNNTKSYQGFGYTYNPFQLNK